jgi:hypothetical protein
MQECKKFEDLKPNPKFAKIENLWEKSSYLDLISKMRWESLQTFRDLAENHCGSVWAERK